MYQGALYRMRSSGAVTRDAQAVQRSDERRLRRRRSAIGVVLAGLLSLIVACPAGSTESATAPRSDAGARDERAILVFGDSLSAAYGLNESDGWVAGLADALEARGFGPTRVTNASISGETTAGGRARFADALADAEPDWVLLQLGANDGLRGLSIEAMRDNLRAMIDMAEAAGAQVVLLGVKLPPSLGRRYLEAFDAAYAELGATVAGFHPFFIEAVLDDEGLLQDDGLHPTREAQPRILETVLEVLTPLLASDAPSAAGSQYRVVVAGR